ncbi:MAG: hypothetical protein NTZ50_13825 [Chloroflexi bacterium]|nr:hypothetical protein [Chloroflexota bacterium]
MDIRYHMLIDALAGTPRDLRRLLRPVSQYEAVLRITDGACILDVLRSFAAYESAARTQFKHIVDADHPVLSEALAPATFANADADGYITTFTTERMQTIDWLLTLSQAQWLRTATHERHGTVRLRTLVELHIGRDNEQLARIVDMRESLRKRPAANSSSE